jgi:hypothetical protein
MCFRKKTLARMPRPSSTLLTRGLELHAHASPPHPRVALLESGELGIGGVSRTEIMMVIAQTAWAVAVRGRQAVLI